MQKPTAILEAIEEVWVRSQTVVSGLPFHNNSVSSRWGGEAVRGHLRQAWTKGGD